MTWDDCINLKSMSASSSYLILGDFQWVGGWVHDGPVTALVCLTCQIYCAIAGHEEIGHEHSERVRRRHSKLLASENEPT